MAVDWQDVRYRGDAADVEELFRTYRVNDYLDTFEENRRQAGHGLRERLLADGIRLSERISPRIYRIFQEVCEALEWESTPEVFCLPSPDVNAFAAVDATEEGRRALIGVTAAALEKLEDEELRSILGHEIGHFLFENNRLNALLSTKEDGNSVTVLPPLGESLFLRWRKKAEISADRVGLLASRSFKASATALLKATFGLSERNLNLDVEALVGQIDEIKGRPELIDSAFEAHPLLPIRLKALDLFASSEKAKRHGYPVEGTPLTDEELGAQVDELVALTRRYPYKPIHKAVMRVVALGGAALLGADGDVSDDEVKILVQILHHHFTDEPELEIVTDREEGAVKLEVALEEVKKDGENDDKLFVMSRLADIALADGALMDSESTVILDIAARLGVPEKTAYNVLVGAAQNSGFRADAKLNRIAADLRRSLQMGLV